VARRAGATDDAGMRLDGRGSTMSTYRLGRPAKGSKWASLSIAATLAAASTLLTTSARAQEGTAEPGSSDPPTGFAPPPTPIPPPAATPAPEDPGEAPPAPRPRRAQRDGARGFVELRGGLATYASHSDGFGTNFGIAGGLAWGWIDLGIVLNHVSIPHDGRDSTSVIGVGPELATRTWLGGPATLRLAIDPQYRAMRDGSVTTGTLGADLLAQFLFTINEETTPAWRVGVGVRGGRWWEQGNGATTAYWTAGIDVVVRSWW
jgi:hypothetical protein